MEKRTVEGFMNYFDEQYKETVLDLRFARSIGDKRMIERCCDDLRRISNTACNIVGFKFADSLREKYIKEGDYI